MEERAAQSLVEAHRSYTRRRIIEAAVEVLQDNEYEELLVAAVAARAGVAERTLYRYFPTRVDLVRATWADITARFSYHLFPDNPERLVDNPLVAFPAFDREEKLIRAIVATRQGKELRLSVNAERHAAIRKAVALARPDLDEKAQLRLSAVAQLLHSSIAWQTLSDYWGLDGEQGGLAAAEALSTLLNTPMRLSFAENDGNV